MASTGLLLLVVFGSILAAYISARHHGARESLQPALKQATIEYKENPDRPDLTEIYHSNPAISVAVFDKQGNLLAREGKIQLDLLKTGGEGPLGGVQAVYDVLPFDHGLVEAATGWKERQDAINSLAYSLFGAWFPLVAIIGVVTWLSSRSTFKPLQRMARQAETFSFENLSARLDVEGAEYAPFAAQLNGFLGRLEASVRREERFISDAAHELRTPLAVLRGRVETCLLRERSTPEYKSALKEVLNETERLTGLVEMLLQSGTVAEGGAPPLDLQENAERAHARWVDRFTDRNVALELCEQQVCSAPLLPREFDVILDNLLSNALKASPDGTACRLVVSCGGGIARVEVSDQGPGVPVTEREAIFERFTRLDEGRNRTEGGFGIGLAVCRRIAEGRGGRVFVGPSDVGARFVVELPAA